MVEPINLNLVRKARAKTEAERRAAENRLRYGLSKAEKMINTLAAERARRALDRARREE